MLLPPELEPHRAALLRTALPFIKITPAPSRATQWWESKVGGCPYWPKDQAYPTDPSGRELFFLAQINFEDVPSPPQPFPKTGILQFYINDDDLYGMYFNDGETPGAFHVQYFPEVHRDEAKLRTKFDLMRPYEDLPHHPDESHPLSFYLAEEQAPVGDFRFWEQMGQDFFQQFGDREWAVMDAYEDAANAQGHKIGGYAYFTQDDPRSEKDPMLLLFQLDSDESMDLMWGDMGVGHFFIREQDLRNRDFSNVLYDWDCC